MPASFNGMDKVRSGARSVADTVRAGSGRGVAALEWFTRTRCLRQLAAASDQGGVCAERRASEVAKLTGAGRLVQSVDIGKLKSELKQVGVPGSTGRAENTQALGTADSPHAFVPASVVGCMAVTLCAGPTPALPVVRRSILFAAPPPWAFRFWTAVDEKHKTSQNQSERVRTGKGGQSKPVKTSRSIKGGSQNQSKPVKTHLPFLTGFDLF